MGITTHIDVYEPSEDNYKLFIANSMIYVLVSFRPPHLCPSDEPHRFETWKYCLCINFLEHFIFLAFFNERFQT